MDISLYFEPISLDGYDFSKSTDKNRLGKIISIYNENSYFPDLKGIKMAIIGVMEERGALENTGCKAGPNQVRDSFYSLHSHWENLKLVDLGNIKNGHSKEDTFFAIKEAVAYLLSNNIVPIIIGGSQDITYANYLAYENIGKIINIAAIDPQFDIGHDEHELNSKSYISRIILHQPNFLFNLTNIGYQSYLVDLEAVSLMKNLFFDVERLGVVRKEMEEVEPMVRNADIVSIDLSAVRFGDSPGCFYAGPNGFSGDEICRISRYAGLSDKLSSIGFYEYNPKLDTRGQSAQLMGQMVWYFIDGFMQRKGDQPEKSQDNYVKYIVNLEAVDEELVFLKSKKSDRWWMLVSLKNKVNKKYRRHQFVPCSYNDYMTALNHEIPERWWKLQQKII